MGAFLHETMGKDKEIASLKQEFQVNQYKTFINTAGENIIATIKMRNIAILDK